MNKLQSLNSEEMMRLMPANLQKDLEKSDCLEIGCDYDGREDGNYSTFSIYKTIFGKEDLDLLFSHANYPMVQYSKSRGKLYVEIDLELV